MHVMGLCMSITLYPDGIYLFLFLVEEYKQQIELAVRSSGY